MDIKQLVNSVALEDIRLIEKVIRLNLDQDGGVKSWALADDEDNSIGFQVNQVSWGKTIEAWFRLEALDPAMDLSVAYAITYTRGSDEEIPKEVRKEFLELIAAMAVMPYLRQGFQSLGAEARIGNLLIPMIRSGDINLDPEEF